MEEGSSLAHSFRAVAARFPGQVCVIHAGGDGGIDRRYTFWEIWSSVKCYSRQIASALDAAGSKDPDSGVSTVGVMIPRSAEYLVAILAVNKAAAVFVPLDSSWPLSRITEVMVDSKASLIVGCDQSPWLPDDYQNHFSEVSQSLPCRELRIGDLGKLEVEERTKSTTWPCSRPPFSYIMYTSGSTGKPKGVCGTDTGLLNRLQWMEDSYPHSSSDVGLFKTAIGFIDHLTESLGPLFAGASLVIPCERDIKRNPLGLLNYLQAFSVTRLVAVPSLLRALLPAFQASSSGSMRLCLLVSSGEALSYRLVLELRKSLPWIRVLNLYGSTEVSGDCSCFDCNELSDMFSETNVPIGTPITGCFIHIQPVDGADVNFGELCISGAGVSHGYWNDESGTSLRFFESEKKKAFRTGDLARRLENGDIILVGRTDRLFQVHGQRVEPEEVERCLEENQQVKKSAVYPLRLASDDIQLAACVILKANDDNHKEDNLREWLTKRLPSYMVPERYIFVDAFPLTSSGKVDYSAIQKLSNTVASHGKLQSFASESVQRVIQSFSEVLLSDSISPSDDFFLSGGTSVSAAHAAHLLGIDMRLLFKFRTALELYDAMQSAQRVDDDKVEVRRGGSREEVTCSCYGPKRLKTVHTYVSPRPSWPRHISVPTPSVFVRHNQYNQVVTTKCNLGTSGSREIQVTWGKCLHACVDASPLLLTTTSGYRLYIGSHAWKFFCIDAISGEQIWETSLGGRVESTAAVTGDFSQVVVGCYDGFVYFLDPDDGRVMWRFQTDGEVKCQPVVDTWEGYIWCGSHDHIVYVLDPISRTCIWRYLCHGSIFGSPATDALRKNVYIATTGGRLYLICTQPNYGLSWERDVGAPIFASPNVDSSTGNVLVAAVDGSVTAFSSTGDIAWKVNTLGPVFSGVYTSSAIFHQVLVCSRDGHVYSYCQISGKLLWKICLEEPIVAGPWIDEAIQLVEEDNAYRLLCVCTTSGNLYVLKAPAMVSCDHSLGEPKSQVPGCVAVIGKFKLPGDVFSTPMVLGGQIFVGCRDNNFYSLSMQGGK
ncbi:putative acyl-activating enzyme 19 isoform X1 [Selaginella moellendorffii]|uniref:putative acyl-activating enzyme 19 isoform X1 n=1 Tax=Selaginella moellendorffii TaxID=88036 RepID=UPI000D1C4EBC|nr:putative acyl-activating enzyme 19 isoform X1 [Selaginella moellendorffii]|eukprot:XP_024536242.1 putative acyl-activating enzyme 19 isoform X1 [Selaginella moellendorffii]